ncbi:heme exporter protein D [Mesorhizobium sp. J18]|uniref:heme exporter protein CcmD n=1 Tax=Mesorhizobium sp. J18 TaxID=935263 RepID=UPI00119BDB5C|nr:heme exporter protein CcmD [Mesorhizobium sp. J18]TWG97073.1 heme exporter protein D [Mesorhizobium sp. J18]
MTHILYVVSAYGISALVIAGLFLWLLVDQNGRMRELAELEARGVKRRSARWGNP